jgi:hypothetical protein
MEADNIVKVVDVCESIELTYLYRIQIKSPRHYWCSLISSPITLVRD